MSNYKNIIDKILDDAEFKKNDIVSKAKKEADKIIKSKLEEANSNKEKIISNAHKDGERLKEKIISKTELNIRKKKLESKKKILDIVFEESLQSLLNLDSTSFKKYISAKLSNSDIVGEYTLIIPSSYKVEDFDDINYTDNLIIVDIKPSDILKGGFILEKNGTYINYSFEILIGFIREELEYEISNLLFN